MHDGSSARDRRSRTNFTTMLDKKCLHCITILFKISFEAGFVQHESFDLDYQDLIVDVILGICGGSAHI
jgi:hypothetical protein